MVVSAQDLKRARASAGEDQITANFWWVRKKDGAGHECHLHMARYRRRAFLIEKTV